MGPLPLILMAAFLAAPPDPSGAPVELVLKSAKIWTGAPAEAAAAATSAANPAATTVPDAPRRARGLPTTTITPRTIHAPAARLLDESDPGQVEQIVWVVVDGEPGTRPVDLERPADDLS